MFNTHELNMDVLNREKYRDKVLGCWLGKNIGGTLGAPFEGKREIQNVKFYTQQLNGSPVPNDDLDLQLVWLNAVERHGVYGINERILGDYWLACICGSWNEYGTAKFNMRNGFPPPLSGWLNNDNWKNSNGAWIRSEIWACLFPGSPEEAVQFAWYDACVDHADEGIYAEIFTVALESAAFLEHDILRLIEIALTYIPTDCRVAASIGLAVDLWRKGCPWTDVREALVEQNRDMGWFQAPANLGFMITGLLYGNSDFAETLCTAVNCGDDTDCTAATCGAILGILNGRSGIPETWVAPIGESIRTWSLIPYRLAIPATLSELTDRVIACRQEAAAQNPTLPGLTAQSDSFRKDPGGFMQRNGQEALRRILMRRSDCFCVELGRFGMIEFFYSPLAAPEKQTEMELVFSPFFHDNASCRISWNLPDGWSMRPGPEQHILGRTLRGVPLRITVVPGEFPAHVTRLAGELWISDRNYPIPFYLPFQLDGATETAGTIRITVQQEFDRNDHRLARIDREREMNGNRHKAPSEQGE